MARSGDTVEVVLDDETLKGQFLPAPQGRDDIIVLKLSSGYNLIVNKDRIRSLKVLQPRKVSKPKSKPIEPNPALPTISLLHTGGTIAARIDYSLGAVLSGFITADELLAIYPELKDKANIRVRMVCNIASEDMRFGHYNLMLQAIQDEIRQGTDAIIIPHGTDTMHYTSAALAFGLEGLTTPVILVGSQRSSDRGSSDAYTNLLGGILFATKSDFGGVAICMHRSMGDDVLGIFPPLKVRKMHTTRRDTFRPINARPIAEVDWVKESITFISSYPKKAPQRDIIIKGFDEKLKIGFLKAHPNMFASEVAAMRNCDGVVIEGTALGHFPNAKADALTAENARIFKAVQKLIAQGVVTAVATQCLYGRIQLNVYTPLRRIRSIGVKGHLCDMTPETTFIKLAWLLSNHTKAEARELLEKDLRGEISSRHETADFLD